jgi:hypothetical protein
MNTGGVVDSKRDLTKYPVPGQMAMFDAQVDITPITTVTTYNDIPSNFILTGSYHCNGTNSTGRSGAASNTYEEQCKNLGQYPKITDGKYMSAFEIKWEANKLDNPYVVPIMRWNVFWQGSAGNVSPYKVTRVLYKNEWSSMVKIPEGSTSIHDPALKYFMGLKENDPNGGKYWKK